jgi:hypothetical protein
VTVTVVAAGSDALEVMLLGTDVVVSSWVLLVIVLVLETVARPRRKQSWSKTAWRSRRIILSSLHSLPAQISCVSVK